MPRVLAGNCLWVKGFPFKYASGAWVLAVGIAGRTLEYAVEC